MRLQAVESCRRGTSRRTPVADPWQASRGAELHDGVLLGLREEPAGGVGRMDQHQELRVRCQGARDLSRVEGEVPDGLEAKEPENQGVAAPAPRRGEGTPRFSLGRFAKTACR